MSREWKPGEVVKGKAHLGDHETVLMRSANDLWLSADNSYRHVADCRPLVLIDPEDREAVERFAGLLHNYDAHLAGNPHRESAWASLAADALREFAKPKPPKPEEPTNPAARVTDRRENVWRLLADGDWVCTSGPDIGEYLAWDRLADERGPLAVES